MNSPNLNTQIVSLAHTMRPRVMILSWLIYAGVTIIYAGVDVQLLLVGLVLFLAMYGVVAIQNDLSDRAVDIANQRADIPYAYGRVSHSRLQQFMFFLSVVATTTGLIIGYQVLLLVGLYILLGWLYSGPINLKSRGVWAALLLGCCYGVLPWVIGLVAVMQPLTVPIASILVASWLFSTGIVVLKDFRDVKGDRRFHKHTLLVMKGPVYVRRYYLVLTTVAYLLLAVGVYASHQSAIYYFLLGVVAIGNVLFLQSTAILTSAVTRLRRGSAARLLFFTTAMILLATTAI